MKPNGTLSDEFSEDELRQSLKRVVNRYQLADADSDRADALSQIRTGIRRRIHRRRVSLAAAAAVVTIGVVYGTVARPHGTQGGGTGHPASTGSIQVTAANNSKVVSVGIRQRVTVELDGNWTAPTSSSPGLRRVDAQQLDGRTIALFSAEDIGSYEITATRTSCPQASPNCAETFIVTITVGTPAATPTKPTTGVQP